MPTAPQEQLRLLSIFHYVLAGVTAAFSLLPLVHVAMGVAMLNGAFERHGGRGEPPPPWLGWLLVGVGGGVILCGLGFAVVLALAGRSLAQRRRWLVCLVVAAFSCLNVPLGTVLGVFTIVVLQKPEVQALFGRYPPAAPTMPPPPPPA